MRWLLITFAVLAFGCSEPVEQPPPDIGRQVADDFLAHLAGNKPDDAWESTSAEFKSDEGRESFRDFVRARPVLTRPLIFLSAESIVVNEVPRTEFRYRSADEKAPQSVKLVVGKEGDGWKVERVLVE